MKKMLVVAGLALAVAVVFHATPAPAATPTLRETVASIRGETVPPTRTIKAALVVASPQIAVDTVSDQRDRAMTDDTAKLMPLLLMPFLVGALRSVALDITGPAFPGETLRVEHNRLAALNYYLRRNGLISTTVATLPLMAIGTTKDLVKSTNATVTKHAGVLGNAVAAADDAWAPTGAAIVNASGANQFVRYLLLVDAADAKTVKRSTTAATAAACEFDALPVDGLAIMGILTVQIANGTTFTPDTTLLDAAGIVATFLDGDADDAVFALGGGTVTR